jgi:hypothetical protein
VERYVQSCHRTTAAAGKSTGGHPILRGGAPLTPNLAVARWVARHQGPWRTFVNQGVHGSFLRRKRYACSKRSRADARWPMPSIWGVEGRHGRNYCIVLRSFNNVLGGKWKMYLGGVLWNHGLRLEKCRCCIYLAFECCFWREQTESCCKRSGALYPLCRYCNCRYFALTRSLHNIAIVVRRTRMLPVYAVHKTQ